MRALRIALAAALLLATPALAQQAAPAAAPARGDFTAFVEGLRADAAARGVSGATFEAAFRSIPGPDPEVLARIGRQGEFSRPVWEYLTGAVSAGRVARGRTRGEALAGTLARIEARYGVPRAMLLALWGVESDFGASGGGLSVVRSLATLAQAGHRGTLFRDELLAALVILQKGDVPPDRLKGSWAGAMGQVQFLPSVYLAHAVDFDGDGRRDIWGSDADALASIAAYLRALGWDPALSWGYEVRLPGDFDLTRYTGPLADFAARGAKRTDGKPLPGSGEGSLFLPGGIGGPVFLITGNFEALRGYNTSDAYALAAGHLADRIAGGPALSAPWPSAAARLDRNGLLAFQKGLAREGLYGGDADGRAGPKLREAVRRYQIRERLPADGYATPDLLKRIETR